MSDQMDIPKVSHPIRYWTVFRAKLHLHVLWSFCFSVIAQIDGYLQEAWGVNDEIMVKGPTANAFLRGSRLPACIECTPIQE